MPKEVADIKKVRIRPAVSSLPARTVLTGLTLQFIEICRRKDASCTC